MNTFSRSRRMGWRLQLLAVSSQPSANPYLDGPGGVSPLVHFSALWTVAEPRVRLLPTELQSHGEIDFFVSSMAACLRGDYRSTNFPNIFSGSIAMKMPRLRARTSPFSSMISAALMCWRP